MDTSKTSYGMHNASSLYPANSMIDSDSFDGALSKPTPDSRLYNIYNTVLRHDYNVTGADKTPIFHIHNSTIKPKKPDLTIHSGGDENGTVLAVCKFLHFSRHFKVCLGDPHDLNLAQWEDLVCQNMRRNKYRWQMTIPNVAGPQRRSFVWKSTHHVGIGDDTPSIFNARCWKLVEEQTGQVVAVFLAKNLKSFTKSGKLQIDVNYGQDFDLMVLITVLALYEKQRRRSQNSAGGGGGGGGGG
ncbi:hypothetical protein FE257_011462 [Aspergillus nanangensis]|uniref:Uncharacterized protein n=1 Tax=Aspergillus nanangensis TaxID=2582783 RepID=A0AAD4CH76_ASPNN|nr:hypothetical protein FE257_011462 [Aspergillus nanangensis]